MEQLTTQTANYVVTHTQFFDACNPIEWLIIPKLQIFLLPRMPF